MAALGWQPPEQDRLGDWLLRAGGGFTGRANSALAIGDPGLPLPAAVAAVCRWFAARDLSAMIAVPFPLAGPDGCETDRYLARLGWAIRPGGVTVMTALAGAVAGCAAPAPAGVDVAGEPDDAWLERYHYQGRELPPVARTLLMSAPWQAFASAREGGRTLAVGRVAGAAGPGGAGSGGAISGGANSGSAGPGSAGPAGLSWAGITAVEVAPEYRRRGLGRAITAALAETAVRRGVAGLYLQVENGNEPARRLYQRMGFTGHHRYHYRVAPGARG